MNRVKQMLSRPPFLLAPLCLALAACGGSGSSSDGERFNNNDSSSSSETVERVSLTGLAVKGVVHGAKAELFRVIDGAVEATPFATGKTDDEGRYELTVVSQEAFDGPALVRIRWQPDAEMTCDANSGCGSYSTSDNRDSNSNGTIDFGERFDLEETFQMTALIPRLTTTADSDRIVTAHISSLTHMAATLAAGGVITPSSADAANNQIRAVLGLDDSVDIVITPPVDVTGNTATPGSAEYGALTSAIAELAKQKGITIQEALNQITQAFLDNEGQLIWRNSSSNLSNISIADVANAAQSIAGLLNDTDLVMRFQALLDMASTKNPDTPSDIHPPIANAGTDQSVQTNTTVTLSGSSENGGDNTTYEWQQISGPAVTLTNPETQQATFNSGLQSGNLVFRLTATNTTSQYSDTDYLTITVKAASASGSAVSALDNTRYTVWNPAVYMTADSSNAEHQNQIGYGLEVERDLTITANASGASSPLSIMTSGDHKIWEVNNRFQAGQAFSSTTAQLDGQTEVSGRETLPTTLDQQNNLSVHTPQRSETEGDESSLELSSQIHLMPIDDHSWFSAYIDQTDYFPADSQAEATREPIRSEYFINTSMVVRDSDSFSTSQLSSSYGVIALTAGSDTALSQLVASELQQWEMSSSVTGVMTAMANSLTDQNSLGNRIVRYTHQYQYDENNTPAFTLATTPYSIANRTDAPTREDVEINFSVKSNGQLRVPARLLDAVFDSEQVALEGMATHNGQLLMAQLMGQLALGDVSGNAIEGIAYERYVALATSASAPTESSIRNATYQIQGLMFDVNATKRGISSRALSGNIRFGNTDATLSFNRDSATLQNTDFTVNRTQNALITHNDDVQLLLAEKGYLRFTVGNITLEGFASADGNYLILRLMDDQVFQGDVKRAGQGFLIARKLSQ